MSLEFSIPFLGLLIFMKDWKIRVGQRCPLEAVVRLIEDFFLGGAVQDYLSQYPGKSFLTFNQKFT